MFTYYSDISLKKLEKIDKKMATASPPHIGYSECLTFARKYGIIAHSLLTTTEFATLYIDSLTKGPATEYDRVLTYDGFCELLVRIARKVALNDTVTADKKLK